MASKVGAKGQVTIEKRIRDALGVGKGWTVLQRLVDGHVELRFVPPTPAHREHNRSLKGALAKYTDVSVPPEEWTEAREKAWAAAIREKYEEGQE